MDIKNWLSLPSLIILSLIASITLLGCPGTASEDGGGGGDGISIIEGSWSTAIDTLSSANTNSEPKVTFFAAQKAIAVWSSDGAENFLYSNHFDGTVWDTENLEATHTNSTGAISTTPHIASNFQGVAFAAWRGGVGYASTWTARIDDTIWGVSSERKIEGSSFNGAPWIACTFGPDAGAFVVWEDGATNEILAARYSSGAWQTSPAYNTVSSGNSPYEPRVVTDLNGNAFAVWVDSITIKANRYSGGSWDSAADISAGAWGQKSQIAVDPDGNAIAVWVDDSQDFLSNRFSGAAWQGVNTMAANASMPQVAFDPDGNAYAVWGGGTEVYATRFLAGSSWASGWEGKVKISPTVTGTSSAHLASDPAGNIFFVWVQDGKIGATRYEAGTDWAAWAAASAGGGAVLLDANAVCAEPWITVDENGRAIVVWARGGQIYSKRYFD